MDQQALTQEDQVVQNKKMTQFVSLTTVTLLLLDNYCVCMHTCTETCGKQVLSRKEYKTKLTLNSAESGAMYRKQERHGKQIKNMATRKTSNTQEYLRLKV